MRFSPHFLPQVGNAIVNTRAIQTEFLSPLGAGIDNVIDAGKVGFGAAWHFNDVIRARGRGKYYGRQVSLAKEFRRRSLLPPTGRTPCQVPSSVLDDGEPRERPFSILAPVTREVWRISRPSFSRDNAAEIILRNALTVVMWASSWLLVSLMLSPERLGHSRDGVKSADDFPCEIAPRGRGPLLPARFLFLFHYSSSSGDDTYAPLFIPLVSARAPRERLARKWPPRNRPASEGNGPPLGVLSAAREPARKNEASAVPLARGERRAFSAGPSEIPLSIRRAAAGRESALVKATARRTPGFLKAQRNELRARARTQDSGGSFIPLSDGNDCGHGATRA